jgi:uncharacterized protein (DUF2249 family)
MNENSESSQTEPVPPGTRSPSGPAAVEWIEVDARGLEPPQPLVRILEALATLPPGACLLARTDRRPMHLYDQLELRGFVGETEAEADKSFVTRIRRVK